MVGEDAASILPDAEAYRRADGQANGRSAVVVQIYRHAEVGDDMSAARKPAQVFKRPRLVVGLEVDFRY